MRGERKGGEAKGMRKKVRRKGTEGRAINL